MIGASKHHVLGTDLSGSFEGFSRAVFGMGCFWGVEQIFWKLRGVHTTAAGYAGGKSEDPTYDDVCSANTGHAEVVLVVYDTSIIDYIGLLKLFWENHDPTQGMRQGGDVGSQYRSIILCDSDDDLKCAKMSKVGYQQMLSIRGFGEVTTEIKTLDKFHYAEEYHQQYLSKNPDGYCGIRGTGVSLH